MALTPDDIGQFFTEYAGAFNRALGEAGDLRPIADHFTACFIQSHAGGVTCAGNDAEFMTALEKGYAFYRSIGTRRMSVTGVDSYPICEDHSVATVHWRGAYGLGDADDLLVDFDVHYLIKRDRGAMKIFGFIADDEQGALRRAGVI